MKTLWAMILAENQLTYPATPTFYPKRGLPTVENCPLFQETHHRAKTVSLGETRYSLEWATINLNFETSLTNRLRVVPNKIGYDDEYKYIIIQ